MTASEYTMQFLADIIGAPVDRPMVTETTALGAAYLAGLGAGICPPPADFARGWALERRFSPQMDADQRASRFARWGRAVQATLMV
jgi:glycerol kinase